MLKFSAAGESDGNEDDLLEFGTDLEHKELKEEWEVQNDTNGLNFTGCNTSIKSNCHINASPNKQTNTGKQSTERVLILLNDLQTAIISGNAKLVQNIVDSCPSLSNTLLGTGWSPLNYAARFAQLDIAKILLKAGADVNLVGDDGCTAMMASCKCPSLEDTMIMVSYLLEAGCNHMAVDKSNRSLITYGVRGGHHEVVKLAVTLNLDLIDTKDVKGWTALDWAIDKQNDAIIKTLISNGAILFSKSYHLNSVMSPDVKLLLKMESTPVLSVGSDSAKFSSTHTIESSITNNDDKKYQTIVDREKVIVHVKDKLDDINDSKSISVIPATEVISSDVLISKQSAYVCGSTYYRYGQLELLLCGLDLAELIPLFHKHDIQFEQLLYLTMDDLVIIGIGQLGVRKRIIDAVKDWHLSEWKERSLPEFDRSALSFSDIQAVLKSSTDHVVYISSALRFLSHQLASFPNALTPPATRLYKEHPHSMSLKQVRDLLSGTHKLCRSLKLLHTQLVQFETDGKRVEQADHVSRRETTRTPTAGRKYSSAMLICSIAFFGGLGFILQRREFGPSLSRFVLPPTI